VVAVLVSNLTTWPVGALAGILAGAFLGVLTAWMFCRLHIPVILAGIICLIAAKGFSFFLAPAGTVDLVADAPLQQTFTLEQATGIALVAVLACSSVALLARSKFGTFGFAMLGNENFVRFRHRYSELTTYGILGLGNGLVGVAGSLLAFKVGSAHVEGYPDFLSIVFGAIFCGEAAVALLSGWLRDRAKVDADFGTCNVAPQQAATSAIDGFRLALSGQRDDSKRFGALAVSYVVAALFLKATTSTVKGLNSFLYVSPAFEQWIVAALITVGFVISRKKLRTP
jgi:hypothetical protein